MACAVCGRPIRESCRTGKLDYVSGQLEELWLARSVGTLSKRLSQPICPTCMADGPVRCAVKLRTRQEKLLRQASSAKAEAHRLAEIALHIGSIPMDAWGTKSDLEQGDSEPRLCGATSTD